MKARFILLQCTPHGPESGNHVGSVACQLCKGQGQNLVYRRGNISPKPLGGVEWVFETLCFCHPLDGSPINSKLE
eukprot:6465507-Amphidinium_carterae.2